MRRSGGWLRASVVVVCGLAVGGGGWWGVEVAAGGSPPAGPDTAGKHVVEMREFKFVPARVEAAVGDTIVWVNKDAVPHTATDSAAAWDSGSVGAEASWAWVPGAAGTWSYVCAFHPMMRGTVVVKPRGRVGESD